MVEPQAAVRLDMVNAVQTCALRNDTSRVFFSSRRRHTRWPRDWSSDVALPIYFFDDGGRQRMTGIGGIQNTALMQHGDSIKKRRGQRQVMHRGDNRLPQTPHRLQQMQLMVDV